MPGLWCFGRQAKTPAPSSADPSAPRPAAHDRLPPWVAAQPASCSPSHQQQAQAGGGAAPAERKPKTGLRKRGMSLPQRPRGEDVTRHVYESRPRPREMLYFGAGAEGSRRGGGEGASRG